ncbi:hypothetical protein ACFQL0_18285 [Haloplanus litoreus]|uniref:hypothetical protein n=1 Tax=Haloplanus litoreus TaxID=767515 RepID=UPI003617EC06
MSGYVAIFTGRSRSTDDTDIVLEPLSDPELEELADRLNEGVLGDGDAAGRLRCDAQ